ncbi:hypothetical protein PSHT_03625 [Puccinia striiformis]|uniref:Superoxide dismutase copper/zinc binding domain-containing protein n=1 Tax=Puccinia striiformis TaxID=27350 RepID=A0A2S4WF43_9BASI|nr:hypothetical protein PSHT_03625 [Puccinia striiformis]
MYPQISRSIDGLSLSLLLLACVPTIVRAQGNTCREATASIRGSFGITGTANFKQITGGVQVNIQVNGLKRREDDQFHIHAKAVTNNDCATTGGHYNPNGARFPCPRNGLNQAACEKGDLSGKGGLLKAIGDGSPTSVSYLDQIINVAEILNKGVVVHDVTNFRLACGNVVCTKTG